MLITPSAATAYQKFYDECVERLQGHFIHGTDINEITFYASDETLMVCYTNQAGSDFQTFNYTDLFTKDELRIDKITNIIK